MNDQETLQYLFNEIIAVYRMVEPEDKPHQLRSLENFLAIAQEGLQGKTSHTDALKELKGTIWRSRAFNDGLFIVRDDPIETERLNAEVERHMQIIWDLARPF